MLGCGHFDRFAPVIDVLRAAQGGAIVRVSLWALWAILAMVVGCDLERPAEQGYNPNRDVGRDARVRVADGAAIDADEAHDAIPLEDVVDFGPDDAAVQADGSGGMGGDGGTGGEGGMVESDVGPPPVDLTHPCEDDGTGPPEGVEVEDRSSPAGLQRFCFGRTEVTVDQYARCVAEGDCPEPAEGEGCNWDIEGHGDHPMNCVSYEDAQRYCGWRAPSGSLPSHNVWLHVYGNDRYPWGEEAPTCERAHFNEAGGLGGRGCGQGGTAPADSLPGGASAEGALNMLGNVNEWVSDGGCPEGQTLFVGGSYNSGSPDIRRDLAVCQPNGEFPVVGLRCRWPMPR